MTKQKAMTKEIAAAKVIVVLEEFAQLHEALLDHGRLSGGQMASKYNMNPSEGYRWVEKRVNKYSRKVRAALATVRAVQP